MLTLGGVRLPIYGESATNSQCLLIPAFLRGGMYFSMLKARDDAALHLCSNACLFNFALRLKQVPFVALLQSCLATNTQKVKAKSCAEYLMFLEVLCGDTTLSRSYNYEKNVM